MSHAPPRVVAYIRVSSKAQSHDMQRAAVVRAAELEGLAVGEWFAEKVSAGTFARPELERLRQAVRARRVDVLLVYALDRLTRTGIRDTFELVEELRANGVRLVTIRERLDLARPEAEPMLAMLAWSAKMERLATNERIASARERVEAEGGAWGRPRREVDELRLVKLREAGTSVRDCARLLRVPRATVQRRLSEMAQKGEVAAVSPGRPRRARRPRSRGASR